MFRRLLTFEEAEETIRRHFKPRPVGVEEIPLLQAHNRVLAEDVVASLDIPPFDRSTVDGYTVKAEDTYGAEENRPVWLKVRGSVNAGEKPKAIVTHGTAAEIVTGAPMPHGSNAVVMKEHTKREDDDLYVYGAVAKDENVMKAGTDIGKGHTALRASQSLGSKEVGVLAAVGAAKVKVYKTPRVAALSTGAEVVEPGRKLRHGKIYDINAYSLNAAVLESGGEPVFLGVFPDDGTKMQKVLEHALESADMVLTSGAVSVGPKDVMPDTLNSLGKPGIIVSGIAVKPGKPTTVALVDGKLIFSLPGHPASALLMFHLLVRPIIRSLAGRRAEKDLEVKASASMRMFPARGRRTYVMVRLKRGRSGQLIAEPVPAGASGAITTLANADGFVEIGEAVQFVDSGEEVTVRLFGNMPDGLA